MALGAMVTVTMLMLLAGTQSAYASGSAYPTLENAKGTYTDIYGAYITGCDDSCMGIYFDAKKPIGQKPTSVKVSNKKIVRVHAYKDGLSIIGKKPGTTKVSFKYKGKKHKITVKIRKYKNPVKSFKIGGKQVRSRLNEMAEIFFTPLPLGKLNIKPAKGWKVKKIEFFYENGKIKTVKNKKAKVTKNVEYVIVTMKNTKKKYSMQLSLGNNYF